MGLMHESVCLTPFAAVVSLDSLLIQPVSGDSAPFEIADDDIPSPDDLLDAYRARAAVRVFLDGLHPRQRDLVVRIFWDDESQASVARSHGVSGAAISKSLNKIFESGRLKLARHKNTHLNGFHMS